MASLIRHAAANQGRFRLRRHRSPGLRRAQRDPSANGMPHRLPGPRPAALVRPDRPDLQADKVVLIAAHGSSLRAIVKHLDQISDEAVVRLNILTGIPLHYEPDDDVKPAAAGS